MGLEGLPSRIRKRLERLPLHKQAGEAEAVRQAIAAKRRREAGDARNLSPELARMRRKILARLGR